MPFVLKFGEGCNVAEQSARSQQNSVNSILGRQQSLYGYVTSYKNVKLSFTLSPEGNSLQIIALHWTIRPAKLYESTHSKTFTQY